MYCTCICALHLQNSKIPAPQEPVFAPQGSQGNVPAIHGGHEYSVGRSLGGSQSGDL